MAPVLSGAALVDGATHWQTLRSIVILLLVPAIGAVSILTFIFAMEAFALPHAFGGSTGNPAGATDLISLLFYRTAFENGSTNAIGGSSPIATLLFLVIFGGAVVAAKVLRRHQDLVGARRRPWRLPPRQPIPPPPTPPIPSRRPVGRRSRRPRPEGGLVGNTALWVCRRGVDPAAAHGVQLLPVHVQPVLRSARGAAGLVIATLPLIVLFLLATKQIVAGLTAGMRK